MGVRPVADFRCECEFEGAPEMEKVRIERNVFTGTERTSGEEQRSDERRKTA